METQMIKCPICGKTHNVEVHEEGSCAIIKGVPVSYEKIYYVCGKEKFITAEAVAENMERIKYEYVKHIIKRER